MTDTAHKVRENRSRRAAARQGLRLSKVKRHDPKALDYGRYALFTKSGRAVNPARDGLRHSWTLDQVEHFLETGARP